MQRLVHNIFHSKGFIQFCLTLAVWSLLLCSACSSDNDGIQEVDRLNDISYATRYQDLDSSHSYAVKASQLAMQIGYENGIAESAINEVFYEIARLNYRKADSLLSLADSVASKDILRLIVEVQRMRLCQRRSLNKDFYFHKTYSDNIIEKIGDNPSNLSQRDKKLFTYTISEYGIVLSTYLYYVNLLEESSQALLCITEKDNIFLLSDTAQYLGYLYNVGSGGILRNGNRKERFLKEFNCLMQCYMIARHSGYKYWEANALQSLSEHLSDSDHLAFVKEYDSASLRYLNDDAVPDSLLSGNLAERSLQLFLHYGDLYQIAGAWRTLSQCYHLIGDHEAQLSCLLNAVDDSLIYQAPDLVASIDEKLSIAYSALNDKPASDFYRNQYLDIQDSTRQDRQLEARADALSSIVTRTQWLISLVVFVLIVLILVVVFLIYMRRHRNYSASVNNLYDLIDAWRKQKDTEIKEKEEKLEEWYERKQMLSLQHDNAMRINVEQHAKIAYTQNILPLIDRMLHSVSVSGKRVQISKENIEYVSDICESILKYNANLTSWVQLRRGQVALHIEKFQLDDLLDIICLNNNSFSQKGINLIVPKTNLTIKADKVLTLFLINTIADNARKYTPSGGTVTINAVESTSFKGYAEISITDNGQGMEKEQCENLFAYKPIIEGDESLKVQKNHGFGLMNCRGIMDRYRKTSELFSHCSIMAESEKGRGTRIFFTLPMVVKTLLLFFSLLMSVSSINPCQAQPAARTKDSLNMFADSVYHSNVNGYYSSAIDYADSCFVILNKKYKALKLPGKNDTLSLQFNGADLRWYDKKVPVDYGIIIFLRNEIAVSALALHDWPLYEDNNKAYTRLYKLCSRDTTLNSYCRKMEEAEQTNDISIIVLAVLFALLAAVFWWFYLRDVIKHRKSFSHIKRLIEILKDDGDGKTVLSHLTDEHINRYALEVQEVAKNIKRTIIDNNTTMQTLAGKEQLVRDEVACIQMECDRLYVSNSIIDNTLSALKHETMYYPSRINQLVKEYINDNYSDGQSQMPIRRENSSTGNSENVKDMFDIISYYRNIYAMLSQQANHNEYNSIMINRIGMRELKFNFDPIVNTLTHEGETKVLVSKSLMDYLCAILKKRNGKQIPLVDSTERHKNYLTLNVVCKNISMSDNEVSDLFSLSSNDFDFLIIRQILREIGTITNCFATGIIAKNIKYESNSALLLIVTLPCN